MKKIKLFILIICFSVGYGQPTGVDKNSELYKNAPDWAKLMFSEKPNVNEVDQLYLKYFQSRAYKKSNYTQYYKHWRRSVDSYLNNDGQIDFSKKAKFALAVDKLRKDTQLNRVASGNWTALGPFKNPKTGGVAPGGSQANILSIGRCEGTPNIMYCGTEPGEVYKSTDGANTWVNVSKTLVTADAVDTVVANAGVFVVSVHPTDPNIVYIGSGNQVFKTTDGGNNWAVVFTSTIRNSGYIINPAEIHINAANPNIILLAGKEGIYRTTNSGANWNQVLNKECYDIKAKPNNPNTLYSVINNTTTKTHQFLVSTDLGLTWTAQTTGWYTSTDPSRTVGGARIAVSAADSNRVYVILAGNSKQGDQNFIGVYKSNDSGSNWANTMGYDGGPYNVNHPNLMTNDILGGFSFDFGEGTMNLAIMASNTNANEILVGGIGMHRSTNAGQSFTCKYNYGCSSLPILHVDQQDYRAFGNEYWATTDGGIFKSNDFFDTNSEFKMDGVRAVDFWGFGSGWNRDILIGGTFHNGVDAFAEGFPSGEFLNLTGGEPQSGYVSPSNQSRVFATILGSKFLPQTITGAVLDAPPGNFLPVNESPWYAESSEIEFHPSCFNYIYKGYENKVFKSLDGGETATVKYTAPAGTMVLGIEISRRNTNTMYVVVRPPYPQSCYLAKTTDDWVTNSTIAMPGIGNNRTLISIDPENDQIIWLAYAEGGNNNLVYKSINGGSTWVNQTTSELNGQTIQSMTTIGGTNGGVYVATNITCYYKNNAMTNWTVFNRNLPTVINAHGLRPFYRDGKIRMASYGKGIWESQLYEQPTRPVAKIMVDKLSAATSCNSIFNFDDYSMLNHTNATWAWTFQDGNISTSTQRNPQVFFNSSGNHLITLKVTNASGVSSTDTITVNTSSSLISATINQDFEVNLLPQNWYQQSTSTYNWSYNDAVGGFGQSSKCMVFDNFNINASGTTADMIAKINMSTISTANAILTFDVAYSFHSDGYQDGLQVLASKDCSPSFVTLYNKVGQQLATGPSTQDLFLPTATQWRTETINLSSYAGTSDVLIKFRNINQFGQALYIDNIKLNGTALSSDDFKFETPLVYPNPATSNGFVTVNGNDNDNIKFNLFSIDGKLIDTVFTKFNTPIPLSNYNLKEGMLLYKIISEDKILNGKLIISDRK